MLNSFYELTAKDIHKFLENVLFDDGCWNWDGDKNYGYGRLRVAESMQRAHRVAWYVYNGPIPDGQYVLHQCDNRACIRPSHLFLGSHKDNMDDMIAKGRSAKGERHSHAKLSEAQVLEIRESTLSTRGIAKVYGISQSQARNVKNGANWRHI